MSKAHRDYFITIPDDGLLTRDVGQWAEQKYRYVGMYADLFSTGMKNRWERRVYLDLFSGPGHSRVRGTRRVVLGSPLVALTLRDPFDTYVFSDADEASVEALEARVARMDHHDRCRFVTGDVNHRVDEIAAHIQGAVGERALSFCFLDPYGLNIHFDTVRRLATGRDIDFLILLALHMDAARNARAYQGTGDKRIERFLGNPAWREQWGKAAERGATIVEFLAEAYSARMAALGYLPMPLDQMVKIRSYDKNLPLYYLAFFTRHKTGLKFWKEVLKYANEQLELPLDGS